MTPSEEWQAALVSGWPLEFTEQQFLDLGYIDPGKLQDGTWAALKAEGTSFVLMKGLWLDGYYEGYHYADRALAERALYALTAFANEPLPGWTKREVHSE